MLDDHCYLFGSEAEVNQLYFPCSLKAMGRQCGVNSGSKVWEQ